MEKNSKRGKQPGKPQYTETQKQEVMKLYLEGKGIAGISTALNIPSRTVDHIIAKKKEEQWKQEAIREYQKTEACKISFQIALEKSFRELERNEKKLEEIWARLTPVEQNKMYSKIVETNQKERETLLKYLSLPGNNSNTETKQTNESTFHEKIGILTDDTDQSDTE